MTQRGRGRPIAALRRSAWLVFALGCGRDAPPAEEALVMPAFVDPAGVHTVAGNIAFADGAVVSAIAVEPDPLIPGESMQVRFTVDGAARPMEVAVRPPSDGGRQVALGGPDAPPPTIPVDPRAVFATADGRGPVSVALQLPAPWHPRTAMITVQREGTAAVSGPRTHDGRGVLALPDVRMTPTAAQASRGAAEVDGTLDDAVWSAAPRYALTMATEGEPFTAKGLTPTHVQFAWDDTHLFVAASLPDRDIRATYASHDDPLWKEEAFEVFVFGDAERNRYLELQVSARGVTFDKRFTGHRVGEESWTSTWRTAVAVAGTIEDPSDRDVGWTFEGAIAWAEICEHTEVSCPPAPGTTLRVNVFRLERARKGNPVALSLSPTRVSDFHAPENAAVLELLR